MHWSHAWKVIKVNFKSYSMSENQDTYPREVILSGADCFFLAMEDHYKKYGTSGNICHLMITLDSSLSLSELSEKLDSIEIFNWLSNIELDRGGFMGLPKWIHIPNKKNAVIISEIYSESKILPDEIVQNGFYLDADQLFKFTLIQHTDSTSSLVFSWHHILMDARGAETLMRLLAGEISENVITFFPKVEKRMNFFKAFYILHFSKEFVKKTSRKPLVELISKKPNYIPVSKYHILKLSKEQTDKLDKRTRENGGTLSKGSFYLACTTKAINDWLVSKGNTKGAFWIPVPQNRRPKGGYGPVISNLQAFMFYRIPREKLSNLKSCAEFITSQMIELIRHKRPDDYAVMSNLLRRLPSKFYYWLIKGPAGGSTASFLYTDPGVNVFNTFMGRKLTDITNFPPATFPPGLITVFERFNGQQKIIINHTLQIVNKEDLAILEDNLLKELLG